MTTKVEKIAEQVKALPNDEREEFLSWLTDFEIEHSDDWDKEIARERGQATFPFVRARKSSLSPFSLEGQVQHLDRAGVVIVD